jgi:small subunit ribosomal protein S20
MANHKSAQKRARQTVRRTAVNTMRRSRIRSSVKEVENAIAKGDKSAAEQALKAAQPVMQSGASKGVVHRNTVSRKISRLAAAVRKLG